MIDKPSTLVFSVPQFFCKQSPPSYFISSNEGFKKDWMLLFLIRMSLNCCLASIYFGRENNMIFVFKFFAYVHICVDFVECPCGVPFQSLYHDWKVSILLWSYEISSLVNDSYIVLLFLKFIST